MATTLQYRQTAERVRKGVAAMHDEIRRQTGAIKDRAATISDLDLRAIYLATDPRAARVFAAASHLVSDTSTAPAPEEK